MNTNNLLMFTHPDSSSAESSLSSRREGEEGEFIERLKTFCGIILIFRYYSDFKPTCTTESPIIF